MKIVHASGAGFPCDRKIWYEVNDYEGEYEENRILEIGTFLEPKIVEFLRRDGWEVIYNPGSQNAGIELTYELHDGILQGHFDCFISKGQMQNVLADIKTMNDRTFTKWKQQGTLKSKPQYADQVTIYAGAALQAGYTVEHLAIVGFNKNNSKMYIDIFDYDPKRFKAICERSQRIIDSAIPPTENCHMEGWTCSYCAFTGICDLCQIRKNFAEIADNPDMVHTTDGQIISAMDQLLAARDYQHAGAAMEKEAKAILDAKVIQQGIRNIQGGNFTLRITEKSRTTFDTKAFKQDHPELVSSYMKQSNSVYYEIESSQQEADIGNN